MNDILEAMAMLNRAFAARRMTAPAFITVEPRVMMDLKAMFGREMNVRYAATGVEVVEIMGVRFTDRLPGGCHWPTRVELDAEYGDR